MIGMPPEWLALAAAIVADTPPLPNAACRGMAPAFDAPTRADTLVPLAVCKHCPELEHCRTWLAKLPPDQRPIGVVAGQVHRERPSAWTPTGRRPGRPPKHAA